MAATEEAAEEEKEDKEDEPLGTAGRILGHTAPAIRGAVGSSQGRPRAMLSGARRLGSACFRRSAGQRIATRRRSRCECRLRVSSRATRTLVEPVAVRTWAASVALGAPRSGCRSGPRRPHSPTIPRRATRHAAVLALCACRHHVAVAADPESCGQVGPPEFAEAWIGG